MLPILFTTLLCLLSFCLLFMLCYILLSVRFLYYMWSFSIYTLFRISINYISNLCFEIIKALYLFRICLNFILLLTCIVFCPYYCINKSVKQF